MLFFVVLPVVSNGGRLGLPDVGADTLRRCFGPCHGSPCSWENTSLLCEVESDADLESWAHAIAEDVDLRPMQSELDRAKVDIELKAKEAWTSREEGIWGGL